MRQKKLEEMSLEELWQLFPIVLTEHQAEWKEWYLAEEALLKKLFPTAKISHIGSTAVPEIWAKPIVDILLEFSNESQLAEGRVRLEQSGYICMSQTQNRSSFNKGYTEQGFAPRVFHLHLRLFGDHDELYFRDYLIRFPQAAKEYEALKLSLWKQYPHHRDAYTAAKGEFVKIYTEKAKALFRGRY